MIGVNRREALLARSKLISMSVISRNGKCYTVEFLHESGEIYFLRQYNGYTFEMNTLAPAETIARELNFERFSVRMHSGNSSLKKSA